MASVRPNTRGKHTIFFGAAPGVGKTYAMLEAARESRDVVVAVVETHARYDTARLLLGLELLPRRKVARGTTTLEDLDLEAALARHPSLVVVDELAHTTAPGGRHVKRWQEVEELLDAGIDVYSTLNVQHLESVKDVVAESTGIVVQETVPDRIFDEAHDVRLIDLPPDELLERGAAGDERYLRKGNLIALRELALRRTAERVDAQMATYRRDAGIDRTWAVTERLLVCVSPSPASARLVRAAKRMAASLHATWIALYVETPAALRLTSADRDRVWQHLRLAEQLGAETIISSAPEAASEIVRYARSRNVTKIVVGKPTHPRWRDLLGASFVERVVRASRDIDVHVISGDPSAPPEETTRAPETPAWRGGLLAAPLVVGITTAIAWLLFGRTSLPDVVMIHLLAIVLVSMRFGYGASLLTAVLSVLAYDVVFVPPYFSLRVSDARHVVTFGVMFLVAIVISRLTQRTRDQAEAARTRERRTARLYAMSRDLAAAEETHRLATTAAEHLRDAFEAHVAIFLPGDDHAFESLRDIDPRWTPDDEDQRVARWVRDHGKAAGATTDTHAESRALFLPLDGSRGRVGVLAVRGHDPKKLVEPEQRRLLDAFAAQIASALERARWTEEAQRAHLAMQAERMQSSLLSAVSHDLRTPLGVITGAASSIRRDEQRLSEEAKRDLLATIDEEAQRLDRIVRNLLDMTRIAGGALQITKEWHPVEDMIGVALTRLDAQLGERPIHVSIEPPTLTVPVDALLIELVLINLLENAVRYTPEGSPLDIEARAEPGEVILEVKDRGPGIAPDLRERVFERFHRIDPRRDGGAGLGLAICRGVAEAHQGRIVALERQGGGSIFRLTLPRPEPIEA